VICIRCFFEKGDAFGKKSKKCSDCLALEARERYYKNKDKILAARKIWVKANRAKLTAEAKARRARWSPEKRARYNLQQIEAKAKLRARTTSYICAGCKEEQHCPPTFNYRCRTCTNIQAREAYARNRDKNLEKVLERNKRYLASLPKEKMDEIILKRREAGSNARNTLKDRYVKSIISQDSGVPAADIPDIYVEFRRNVILVKRLAKELDKQDERRVRYNEIRRKSKSKTA
jgi:hypothetical protein